MFVFIIPVKSKTVSNNWDRFCTLLERTIRSACNQTSDKFRVAVVCHEKPEIRYDHKNLEYIEVSHMPPALASVANEQVRTHLNHDKSLKILKGAEYARGCNADYVMVLDSDDCVSQKIVDWVINNSGQEPGWYFKKGYIYKENSKILWLNTKNFNTLCGSCVIIRPDLLPYLIRSETFLYYSHMLTKLQDGAMLIPFPHPYVIYSIANGENILMTKKQSIAFNTQYWFFSMAFIRSILRKLAKYRPFIVNEKFRRGFGLTQIDN